MFGIIISLTELSVGKSGAVAEITVPEPDKRRLLDLGFVPGTRVKSVRKSPAGNPTAYLIRDTVIALRREQTDRVLIKPDYAAD